MKMDRKVLLVRLFIQLYLLTFADADTAFCGYVRNMKFEDWDSGYDPIPNNYARDDYSSNDCKKLPAASLDSDISYYRAVNARNGIQDFCVASRMQYGKTKTAIEVFPIGQGGKPIKGSEKAAPSDCYKIEKTPAVFHAAGPEKNWLLLNHLAKFRAQSYQPLEDLPYVAKYVYHSGLVKINLDGKEPDRNEKNPITRKEAQKLKVPVPNAPNPYFVEVSGISYKGELLHNFLHFRIFANMSVALGKNQRKRDNVLHGRGEELPNFASGRISALVIMIKDQDGWPVGDFSTPVPCDRTCSKFSHDVYYGDETNAVPCSYTPPYASTHPGMFVYDSDPGRYCAYVATMNATNVSSMKNTTYDPRLYPETARLPGVREVHATWSFSHDSCNFVEKLFVQTLIFEDVEQVFNATMWRIVKTDRNKILEVKNNYVLFGWSAQYNVLKPTKGSLGAADYVNLRYFKERVSRYDEIDCHVPLFDSVNAVPFTFRKGVVPSTDAVAHEAVVPARSQFYSALSWMSDVNPKLQYFGDYRSNYPEGNAKNPEGRNFPTRLCRGDSEKNKWMKKLKPISELLLSNDPETEGMRCPCPALPSEEPIENRTADPARVHGRLIHASHMTIAYMFLTPIGCFVARYYKETFVTVFCFQEYWWYMWHVVTLICACLFNVGAITSIARKKTNEIKYNENLMIHVILGAISIFVFYMEIFTGFFRVASPRKRMRQIFMHWLIGTLNNACAVVSMFAMAWVDQSGFTCNVAWTSIAWIIFVVICFGVMEYNMRRIDKKLRLVPRRSYLPPPVKRLFTKEPPGREFRMIMLAVFVIGLLIIQGFISYFIWSDDSAASCHEELQQAAKQKRKDALSKAL